MPKKISFKRVLKQLKADLIGKDSYRGVTLTYSWLANQFGHLSLGVIPTLILFSFVKNYPNFENPIISSCIISLFWLIFELYNFLGPLLINRISSSKLLYIGKGKRYIFQPDWLNVAFDTFTDLCFFWLGAFLTSLFIRFSKTVLIIDILIIIVLIYPSIHWYLVKMYQNYANYPFQFRLSQWEYEISDEAKEKVLSFMKNKENGNHILIFGSKKSGKTSLGVGITNELSIKKRTCFYTTGIKLYSMFFDQVNTYKFDRDGIWSWRDTEFLIIDDINPGDPIEKELVSPADFLNYIDRQSISSPNFENRELIKNKNIIWILGNVTSLTNEWESMLAKIGVEQQKISSIHL